MSRRLRRIGFVLVASFVLLGVLELVCRRLPYQERIEGVYRTGFTGCWFTAKGGTVTLCEADSGRFGPQTFPEAPGEACRVMFLGGSSVRLPGHHGWPERSGEGEIPVELINLGVPGATSLATALRGQAALRFHPDVLVVYEGHNALAQWSFGSGEDVVRRDVRTANTVLFLENSALFRTLTWAAQFAKPERKREPVEGLRVARAVVTPEEAAIATAEIYDNFAALISAAAPVPVIQIVPVSNPAKSPVATLADPDAARGHMVDEAVLTANKLLEAGDFASALAGAQAATARDPHHAGAWWVAARALQGLHRGPEAVKAYGEARAWDAIPLRSSPQLDDAIRRVPAAEVLDLPVLLADDTGLVPDDLFMDLVHFSERGHARLGKLVAEHVQSACLARKGLPAAKVVRPGPR